jgi:hypothetical protein
LERLLGDKAELSRGLSEAQAAVKAAEGERSALAYQVETLTKERAELQAQVGIWGFCLVLCDLWADLEFASRSAALEVLQAAVQATC